MSESPEPLAPDDRLESRPEEWWCECGHPGFEHSSFDAGCAICDCKKSRAESREGSCPIVADSPMSVSADRPACDDKADEVPEARDLLVLFRLAAMDGYNKKPVSTVDEWAEECKKRMLALYLAGRRSPAADRPVENSRMLSETGRDLIARYFQSVVAYHGEAHHDFEDTQSRAVTMGDRDVALAEYITALEAEISRLRAERLTKEEADWIYNAFNDRYQWASRPETMEKLRRLSSEGNPK